MSLWNLLSERSKDEQDLSLHRPILIRDTPESIGMKVPRGGDNTVCNSLVKKKKSLAMIGSNSRKRMRNATKELQSKSSSNGSKSAPFSVRDVANAVGDSVPVQVINVLNQEIEDDLADWTFSDLVKYFEDEQRMNRTSPTAVTITESPIKSPCVATTSSATGRCRRKAAIRSEEVFTTIISDEGSSGLGSNRILNQISYEFSGTPLHAMVRSPTLVRDIDWIDHAWPAERKPKHSSNSEITSANQGGTKGNSSNIKLSKDKRGSHKGKNSTEYPVVQNYCLTSAAGSYTDFHTDFGGSSVWYHVVSGQKIFVISPPTRQNLQVYEEWLCRSDQAKVFLPDLMKERACPDIHCYSSGDHFSSSSSISTASTASTTGTYASSVALGDLADEMAFFQNSLKNALSTNNVLRFALNAGETLVLPAGWIHSVYTPIDSLVFGGNFMHGFDIQMQLMVNALEARSGVLDQYRFPHFGALQMYAGGMYLKRLKASRKGIEVTVNTAENSVGSKIDRVGETQEKDRAPKRTSQQALQTPQEEQEQGQQQEDIYGGRGEQKSYSNTHLSERELTELPMLMNALEYWWLSEDDRDHHATSKEEEIRTATSPNMDTVTSHSSFRDAAFYVVNENGCESVEDFIAALRTEYARVSNERWGGCIVAPSDDPNRHDTSAPPLSTIPIAIGKPGKKNISLDSAIQGVVNKRKKAKPRHKKRRKRPDSKSSSELDDPLDVALSKGVKEYLASIQITTAAQFLMARTTDIAEKLPEWRKEKGMAELKGRCGAVASVSVWKRKVRLRAALVGAKKLAQLNEGTNMKPLGLEDDDKTPAASIQKGKNNHRNNAKYKFRRVAKELNDPFVPTKKFAASTRDKMDEGDTGGDSANTSPRVIFGTAERAVVSNNHELWHIRYDDGDETDLDLNKLLQSFELYEKYKHLDGNSNDFGADSKTAHRGSL